MRLQPWWELLLVLVLFVTPLTWCGVAVAQEALNLPDTIAWLLAIGGPVVIVALVRFNEHRALARRRTALAGPRTTVPYVIAPDPAPDTRSSLLLLAAREAPDRVSVRHDGWLQVSFATDQRRLTPAGTASLYGRVATGRAVIVVIDDADRETTGVASGIDDDDVRRLVMPPENPPKPAWVAASRFGDVCVEVPSIAMCSQRDVPRSSTFQSAQPTPTGVGGRT